MRTIIFFSCIVIGFPVFAEKSESKSSHMQHAEGKEHDHKGHDHKDSKATSKKVAKDKLLIKVNGMVCAFCAQGIEKNFNAREEVKSTKVNLDKMEVLVTFVEGKELSESVVKSIVSGAGFQYVGPIK
ncbi:MAG: hypothetical protein CL677_07465 [Bdellovibrionaceae bacterium]|nr:hypothetical protein [Pseudobdellovibrionaceae bacterium]|tara:strand:+ start:248 stop:631 length:384 start_codon:yes stop_codon:yes gene_type:complete